jgi:tetratricopeptide (TPR) repeat protein
MKTVGGIKTMQLQKFFNLYLLVPLGVLSTIFGYAESLNKLTGVSHGFLFTSVGFLFAFWCLVWLIWFSGMILSPGSKKIALAGLVAVSVLYYSFIQYYIVFADRNNVLTTVVELEGAMSLATGQDPAVAVRKISGLMRRFGETPMLLNDRGQANYKLGKYLDAVQDFRLAVQGDPKNEDYVFNLAVALREMCDFVNAKTAFDEYVKSNPGDVQGHYNRGIVYQDLGDYDAALYEYRIVIEAREAREMERERALFNSGVAYALKFARASDQGTRGLYLGYAIDDLNRSVSIGGNDRIAQIRAASEPLQDRRSSAKCEGLHATDDLTALAQTDQFQKWLQEKTKMMSLFRQN